VVISSFVRQISIALRSNEASVIPKVVANDALVGRRPLDLIVPGSVLLRESMTEAADVLDELRWRVLLSDKECCVSNDLDVEEERPLHSACKSEEVAHSASTREDIDGGGLKLRLHSQYSLHSRFGRMLWVSSTILVFEEVSAVFLELSWDLGGCPFRGCAFYDEFLDRKWPRWGHDISPGTKMVGSVVSSQLYDATTLQLLILTGPLFVVSSLSLISSNRSPKGRSGVSLCDGGCGVILHMFPLGAYPGKRDPPRYETPPRLIFRGFETEDNVGLNY
jgi:hypothetical protein